MRLLKSSEVNVGYGVGGIGPPPSPTISPKEADVSDMEMAQRLLDLLIGGVQGNAAAQTGLIWIGLLIVGIVVMVAMSMSQAKRV
jgi:hypothetical protein